MRVFIVVCLISAAFAVPQGYNYQRTGSSSFHTVKNMPSFLQEAFQNTQLMQTLLNTGGNSQQTSTTNQHTPQTLYHAPPKHTQTQQTQTQTQTQLTQQQLQELLLLQQRQISLNQMSTAQAQTNLANVAQPIITKDIYVHVAPEESDEQSVAPALPPPPPPRKHYRIVFIKAPAPNFGSSSALRIKQAPVEEKTIIYVLTKRADPLDLEQALQEAAPKQPSKPEVYFIKYKTQEEAQHAQRTIQAQYDQLGGTTQISDEGVAPVTSVIGSLDQRNAGGSSSTTTTTNINTSNFASSTLTGLNTGSTSGSNTVQAPGQYLPPITRL